MKYKCIVYASCPEEGDSIERSFTVNVVSKSREDAAAESEQKVDRLIKNNKLDFPYSEADAIDCVKVERVSQ